MLTSVFAVEVLPKIASAINTGPIVVPMLFTPPVKLKRWEPLAGSPSEITNGFAAVCCNENPSPTTNSPLIIKVKDSMLAAGIKSSVPRAEIAKPSEIPFLYPIRDKISFFVA